MKKKRCDKRELLTLIFASVLVGSLLFVLAAGAATLSTPVAKYNYSGTMNFSCISVMEGPRNASLMYNVSGGAVNDTLITLSNTSANQSVFENASVNIASLPEVLTYNFSCYMENDSDQVYTTAVANIGIDNTGPAVNFTDTTNVIDKGNYSGTIVINVSASDATMKMGTVYFNISYPNGSQVNFTKASTGGGVTYNLTVITTGFVDGTYNVTAYTNDSGLIDGTGAATANTNNTETIQIVVDNTAPTASYDCSPSTANVGDTVTCTCSPSDATSGVNASPASYTASPSTADTGAYSLTCTFLDMAGNTGNATATYTIELGGTAISPSGSSSTTATSFYTKTIPNTAQEFSEIKTVQYSMKAKERVKLKINSETHYVGVKEVSDGKAKIEIASDPVEVELDVGEEAKVDVDNDGYYDVYVKLNSVTGTEADVTINYINEAVPAGAGAVSTTGEDVTPAPSGETTTGGAEGTTKTTWYYWVIGIVIVLVIAAVVLKKKK